ncbi:MAG: penicillin-binding protein activator [Alphaproteobacteria bacterium]|nr:penicillin-binding protein activator [Alphaproteobacteria bacterium]
MFMNRFLKYFTATVLLSGCAGTQKIVSSDDGWFGDYDSMITGTPATLQYGRPSDGYGATSDGTENMAVLLPLSGQNAQIGKTIRASVETAVLQRAPSGLSVHFYDTNNNLSETINTVLATNPKIIIGPVFADNARLVRESKPSNLPVLSFTSDATAIGDGVMTMALMPSNGIETIMNEMKNDGTKRFIIIAPDTKSGHLMAGTAQNISNAYDITLNGIFFYNEGDTDSIKATSAAASMNNARTTAHTRARHVLSDILTNERLTAIEKSNLNSQLGKLSRTEALGPLPYDAILFLGNGNDTKSLASFLRYYNVGARDARFYGTTMWDGSDIASDFTMSGAKFATLPEMNQNFANVYELVSGTIPNRMATFGYDATNIAIDMIYSGQSAGAYLLNPSGYIGTDGLFRLMPNGTSERGLNIVELNGSGTPRIIKSAPTSFITPLYRITEHYVSPADAMELQTPGIDPDDYINLPERLRDKYRSKTIGTNITPTTTIEKSTLVAILPEDVGDPITSENYKPIKRESVSRSYIDEYEIEE